MLDGTPAEIFAEVDKLRGAGLDLPQCTDLAIKLRAKGIDVSGDINTPEQCADAIARALGK